MPSKQATKATLFQPFDSQSFQVGCSNSQGIARRSLHHEDSFGMPRISTQSVTLAATSVDASCDVRPVRCVTGLPRLPSALGRGLYGWAQRRLGVRRRKDKEYGMYMDLKL